MSKTFSKSIAMLMAAMMLVFGLGATSCFAGTSNVDGASTATAPVNLTQGATVLDFTITESLSATAEAESNVLTIDSLTVINNSESGQIDYDLSIETKNNYVLDDYDADAGYYENLPVDSKKFAIQADGDTDLYDGTYEDAGTALAAYDADDTESCSNTNTFAGKISTASAAVGGTTGLQIAAITATVDWVRAS